MQGTFTARLRHLQPAGSQWRQEGGIPTQTPNKKGTSNHGTGYFAAGENTPAVYGTLGVPSATTQPGARFGSFSWTDNNGRFHLFGGTGLWTLLYTGAEREDRCACRPLDV